VTWQPSPRLPEPDAHLADAGATTDADAGERRDTSSAAATGARALAPRPAFMLFTLVVVATLAALALAYRESAVRDRNSASRALADARLQLDAAARNHDAAKPNLDAQRRAATAASTAYDASRRAADTIATRGRAANTQGTTVLTTARSAAAAAAAMEDALRRHDTNAYNQLSAAYNAAYGPPPSPYATQLAQLSAQVAALAP
jgi:hypothetical protein